MNSDKEELELLNQLLLDIDAIMCGEGKAAKKLRQINNARFYYHQELARLKEQAGD